MEDVYLGFAGLSVAPRTHICGFFRGRPERNSIVAPFLQEGINSGAKCLCILDAPSKQDIAQELGIESDSGQDRDPLDVRLSKDTYLGSGVFSRPEMLAYWETWATETLSGGAYPFARITGEMTKEINQSIDSEEWVLYESELNRLMPRFPQVLLCLYDLTDCSGRLFIDILKTHPMILMGSTVLQNLYYVDPDTFTRSRA